MFAKTYATLPSPNVPREQMGNAVFGTLGHLGSPIFYVVLLAIVGVNTWSAIWTFFAVSVVFIPLTLIGEKFGASIDLPKATRREVFDGLFMVFVKGVIVAGVFITGGWWLLRQVPLHRTVSNSWWLIAIATVGTDFGYYVIHRLLSHSKGPHPIARYYRRQHAAHHSVTELDFFRGNQSSWVDTSFSQFQPTVIVLSYLLGMDLAATWVAYGLILLLQATDHTSVTYNIGWLRYVFMDNHAHKLHHCKRGNLINHAAAFSFFDRLFGTYYEDWSLSSNYLHHHNIALPIEPIDSASRRHARPVRA
jgi:sterol desaturase/sphingolipid hydroxylase (fatty acid hydroxylase superfamily)